MKTQQRAAAARRMEARRLAADGHDAKEIAAIMKVNPGTVSDYLGRYRETHVTNATLYRRFLDDATAAIEEAKELAVKMRLGIVTQAGLNCASEGLRVSRHAEALHKRARFHGNGDGK